MRILIAEDSGVARQMLQMTLSEWGYEVEAACDGAEAVDALERSDAPRLAILDWMMPELDGVDICRRLRQSTQNPYTYLILLTSKYGKADLIHALEAGADDYLTKPFDAEEL